MSAELWKERLTPLVTRCSYCFLSTNARGSIREKQKKIIKLSDNSLEVN